MTAHIRVKICSIQVNSKYKNDKSLGKVILFPVTSLNETKTLEEIEIGSVISVFTSKNGKKKPMQCELLTNENIIPIDEDESVKDKQENAKLKPVQLRYGNKRKPTDSMYFNSEVATTSAKINCVASNVITKIAFDNKEVCNENESESEVETEQLSDNNETELAEERNESELEEASNESELEVERNETELEETSNKTELAEKPNETKLAKHNAVKTIKTSKKRNFQQTSKVWKHFTRVTKNNKVMHVCQVVKNGKICGKEYVATNSTTSLKRHLMNIHPTLGLKASSSTKKSENDFDFDLLTLKLIISSGSPYRLVENKYFKEIINRYTSNRLPTRENLKIIEDEFYEKTKSEIKEKLASLANLAITTDGWTAKALKKSFISLTIHFLQTNWEPDSIELGIFNVVGTHKASSLAEKLQLIFDFYEIDDKISTIVADNASNMQLLAKKLDIHFWGCFAHLLNLIVKNAFKSCFGKVKEDNNSDDLTFSEDESETDEMDKDEEGENSDLYSQDDILLTLKTLLKYIRKIIGLFNSSTLLSDELAESQGSSSLVPIQDVVTRWYSVYLMLERFLKLFHHLKTVLNKTTLDKYDKHRERINLMNNKKTIKILESLLEILKPFYKVTVYLSGQKYSTISIVLHSCYYLKKKLNDKLSEEVDGSILANFQEILKDSFDKYMNKYKVFENEFLCCSTFLNPDYRDMAHCTDQEKETTVLLAKKFINEFFSETNLNELNEEIAPDEPNLNDSVDSFDGDNHIKKDTNPKTTDLQADLKNEIEFYLKLSRTISFSDFWCQNEPKFKYLSIVARYVLSPTATSCPSERLFSAASNQIWARRNRLSASRAEKIMFLLNNLENDIDLLDLN